jgi:hypothetical protein
VERERGKRDLHEEKVKKKDRNREVKKRRRRKKDFTDSRETICIKKINKK